jgi:hypothetical protein
MNIDQVRRELIDKHKLWTSANPQEAEQHKEKMAKGLRDIPINQMYDQLQYIEKEMLPAVKRKNREADIQFFERLCRSLAYAIIIYERYEYLHLKYINGRVELALLRDHSILIEKELQNYTTMEDLFLSDGMNKYAEAIAERVKKDILKVK